MDERELAQLYEAHGWHVLARCRRLLRDEDQARDACQEVFLRLAERGTQVRGPGGVTPWVFAVTTNLCIDRLRARRRRQEREQALPAVDLLAEQAADEEGMIARRDLIARLLPRFAKEEVALALLRHVDGLTLEEMEQVCGMTRKTISKKLARFEARAHKLVMRIGG